MSKDDKKVGHQWWARFLAWVDDEEYEESDGPNPRDEQRDAFAAAPTRLIGRGGGTRDPFAQHPEYVDPTVGADGTDDDPATLEEMEEAILRRCAELVLEAEQAQADGDLETAGSKLRAARALTGKVAPTEDDAPLAPVIQPRTWQRATRPRGETPPAVTRTMRASHAPIVEEPEADHPMGDGDGEDPDISIDEDGASNPDDSTDAVDPMDPTPLLNTNEDLPVLDELVHGAANGSGDETAPENWDESGPPAAQGDEIGVPVGVGEHGAASVEMVGEVEDDDVEDELDTWSQRESMHFNLLPGVKRASVDPVAAGWGLAATLTMLLVATGVGLLLINGPRITVPDDDGVVEDEKPDPPHAKGELEGVNETIESSTPSPPPRVTAVLAAHPTPTPVADTETAPAPPVPASSPNVGEVSQRDGGEKPAASPKPTVTGPPILVEVAAAKPLRPMGPEDRQRLVRRR